MQRQQLRRSALAAHAAARGKGERPPCPHSLCMGGAVPCLLAALATCGAAVSPLASRMGQVTPPVDQGPAPAAEQIRVVFALRMKDGAVDELDVRAAPGWVRPLVTWMSRGTRAEDRRRRLRLFLAPLRPLPDQGPGGRDCRRRPRPGRRRLGHLAQLDAGVRGRHQRCGASTARSAPPRPPLRGPSAPGAAPAHPYAGGGELATWPNHVRPAPCPASPVRARARG